MPHIQPVPVCREQYSFQNICDPGDRYHAFAGSEAAHGRRALRGRGAVIDRKCVFMTDPGVGVFRDAARQGGICSPAGTGHYTGDRVGRVHGGGTGCVIILGIVHVYRQIFRRTLSEKSSDQSNVPGTICIDRHCDRGREVSAEQHGVFFAELKNIFDGIQILFREPAGFFGEAIEFLPGDTDLFTEFVDSHSLLPEAACQKGQ